MAVVDKRVSKKFAAGLALHQKGSLADAQRIYRQVLAIHPRHFGALHLLGIIAAKTGKPLLALDYINKAIDVNPNVAEAYNDRGLAQHELKQYESALQSYGKAIALNPGLQEAHSNQGNVLLELKQHAAALLSFNTAISLQPDFAQAHSNRGNVLLALKQPEAALESFDTALSLRSDLAEALSGRGIVLVELRQYEAALNSLGTAIALRPDLAEAYNGRGNALRGLNHHQAAVGSYHAAIALKSDFVEAFYNRGHAFLELGRYERAADDFRTVISLEPDYEFGLGSLIWAKMFLCDWKDIGPATERLSEAILRGECVSSPFTVVASIDSPRLQRKSAEIWATRNDASRTKMPALVKPPVHDRIRIGYFSSDFRNHAILYLMAGMLERHDRAKFEVIAFSFGPASDDAMRRRALHACDRFIDVHDQSDRDIARLARTLEIDIAVDLNGITLGCRTGIFNLRAAPVQASFLGFPGTMGAGYIDYIIADRIVIPEGGRRFFQEKIVYLPDTYQVNDADRLISDRIVSRAELDLPSSGFVFCCFNNSYKILPSIFACWMRILRKTEGSVLWLLEANQTATENLRKEAAARDVDPARLVFAGRVPLSDHLARHRRADLFLDTLPYNAHTTASDALWVGVPVLTCPGEAFASRVAASLLHAIRLPDLITATLDAYEETAIDLATNPDRLEACKRTLAGNRLTTPLFDTRLFTRHIEAAYGRMYQRYRDDLPPDDIQVEDLLQPEPTARR